MADLTARLLDPETFEEALQDPDFCCCIEGRDAIRELHARLRSEADAEGAAEAYEAEAQEWTEQAVRARHTYVDPGPGRMFERRAVEARDRAAAIRKALAAQSLAPSKCECHIERNPSRMSAAALESGASAEIVGPLCAFCRANARKPPAPGVTDGELLDLLGSLGDNGEVVIDGDLEGERVVLSWNAWGDVKTPREALAALRAERGGK